nr:ATP-binding protein [Hyphomonas sp. Mor2]
MSRTEITFRPRSRLLQLLGDQLIRSARLAVFELVKNSYDADARKVVVSMNNLGSSDATITVSDDGEGMSAKIVRDIWFVPGHDHKEKTKLAGTRSELGRSPLGEKGVGRFAAHKLGNKIKLVTKANGHDEVFVDLDWGKLMEKEYLEDASATIVERPAEVFDSAKTGTKIEISDLRDDQWSKGDLRRLYRDITSICSPFDGPDEFDVTLEVPGREGEFDDIPDTVEILKRAPWHFRFTFDGDKFEWKYEFRPPANLVGRIERRKLNSSSSERLLLPRTPGSKKTDVLTATAELLEGIGPVSGEFYVYDRGPEVLGKGAEKQLVTRFLDANGGVRVYRDGVRVYNYGDEDDDWLSLDHRRFITPTKNISRNNVLGAISVSAETSGQLKEKTNREGFVENSAYDALKRIVLGAFQILETERALDKEAIRKTERKPVQVESDRIKDPIAEIRRLAEQEKLSDKFAPSIDRLEKNYNELRETMLQAGLSGLGLATVFHEIQHGVTALLRRAKGGASVEDIVQQAQELEQLLNGISGLLRKSEKTTISARDLVKKVRQASLIRFRTHRVELVSPLMQDGDSDFDIKINSRLFVGAMTNLLDNSFYWMRARWPSRPADNAPSPRKIYIGASDDFEFGPAIVIADTGPGFQDDPETLVEPFFTRRPDGMGLGFYYTNLVMELSGGELVFPHVDEVDVPKGFDGALVAMVFPGK